jgi:hypothetical protein
MDLLDRLLGGSWLYANGAIGDDDPQHVAPLTHSLSPNSQ